jgi:hypothetical protein
MTSQTPDLAAVVARVERIEVWAAKVPARLPLSFRRKPESRGISECCHPGFHRGDSLHTSTACTIRQTACLVGLRRSLVGYYSASGRSNGGSHTEGGIPP